MATENTSVTTLAYKIGRLFRSKPYAAQSATPKVNTLWVIREMPSVLFSRIIFTACGSQQSVVHAAARLPTLSNQTAISSLDHSALEVRVSAAVGFSKARLHTIVKIKEARGRPPLLESHPRIHIFRVGTQPADRPASRYGGLHSTRGGNSPISRLQTDVGIELGPGKEYALAAIAGVPQGDRISSIHQVNDFHAQRLLEAMRNALQQGNMPVLERSAHSMKGAASNLSAQVTAAAASQLGRNAKSGDMDSSKESLTKLERAVERFLLVLADLCQGVSK